MSKKTIRSKDAAQTPAPGSSPTAHNGPSAAAKATARTAVQTAARGALKADDIKAGGTYGVRIDGKVTAVHIEGGTYQKDQFLGWTAVVVATGEQIIIDPGTRFSRLKEQQADQPQQPKNDQQQPDQAEQAPASEPPTAGAQPAPAPDATPAPVPAPGRKRGPKANPDAAAQPGPTSPAKGGKATKADKPAKEPKTKRLSCIDAAAQVLTANKGPMSAKDMIAEMGVQKLWTSPNGKTPEASLYAAVIREIAAKGDAARFKKVDRGLFVAAGKGA